MHEPYDDDDGYNDDDYNYDNSKDHFKWYFKFDLDQSKSLSDWVLNHLNDFLQKDGWTVDNNSGFPIVQFPVSSWSPSTGNDIKFQYLGSNYQGQQIWKTKYFIVDHINNEYKKHIQAHAKNFVSQPHYYKGMFDILN